MAFYCLVTTVLWYPDLGLFLCPSCKWLQGHEGSGKDTQLIRN